MTLFATSILFLLIVSSAVVAQLPTATILGVVKDATGAVVPEAGLTARNVETGQTRTAVTAGDGSYRFSALPVGIYEVRVEHPGFRSEVRQGLTLTVGQEAVMNFTLEVGGVEQTISVTAEAPLVNTTSGSLGGLVNEQSMAELPLNGRNYIQLSLLQTGVVLHRAPMSTSVGGVLISSNGAPIRSNSYLLDGASMVNLAGHSSATLVGTTLGVEGIREYRVVTNFFSAEYGMTMGSQMTIVTKSGTNTFHGSLFEYLRNSALDARNFFDYKTLATPRRLPAFTRNQFGGSFGGPIKKDQTFFHVVYEGLRERLGRTNVVNAMPASAKVDGAVVPQIAAVIKPFLPLFPEPNLPNNQFTFPFSQPTNQVYGQARVDHAFSSNDTVFGRYTVTDMEQTNPGSTPRFKTDVLSRIQFLTLSEGHVFSPTLLNTFRASFSRTTTFLDSPSGISGPQFSFIPGQEMGNLSITGVAGIGPDGTVPQLRKQNIFTWSDDLFYTRGRHSLKFGALINRYQQYIQSNLSIRGSVTFSTLASFLLAQPLSMIAMTPGSKTDRTLHNTTYGFYVQDDLRVKSNLTLNLGLRYEFATVPVEVHNTWGALRDILRDAEPTLGKPFKNAHLKNFSPRFGFAWDVMGDGKTAVRGGFGLLYDIGNWGGFFLQDINGNLPFSSRSQLVSPPAFIFTVPISFPPGSAGRALRPTDYLLPQPRMLQYNLTVERQLPAQMALTLSYAGSRGIALNYNTEGNPTIPQILPDGRKFWPAGVLPRVNPHWGTLGDFWTGGANSWYNSLQFSLQKRLSRGLQFQSSYTWSKLMDETQLQLQQEAGGSNFRPVDPDNRKLERGPAAFDVTQNWRLNTIYRLPELTSGGAVAKVLNGWGVSGIVSLQSGYPFSLTLGTNRSRSGVAGGGSSVDRPDAVPGRSADSIIIGGPDKYYDPTAFGIQPAGFLGTLGRNTLRGPGFATVDFSVMRDAALRSLGESGRLEFRAEIFNLLNRVNFGLPNRIVYLGRSDVEAALSTAARISATTTTSRQIQLALKILF